jgi:GWxTD domain-containing protein
MKKKLAVLLIALFILSDARAEKLSAYFSYCVFNLPSGTPFVETYLSAVGRSVHFVPNSNGKLQGAIEVKWVLKQSDKIISFDKYNLLSPEIDSTTSRPDFIDQQRITAPNGSYVLELSISDKNSSEQGFTATQNIEVNFPADKISVSDIELLESYQKSEAQSKLSKSGFDLVPSLSNFYSEEKNEINFYAEVYNSKKILGDDDYLIRYYLFNDGNKKITNDLVVSKKVKSQDVSVLLASVPLDKVPSGNYNIGIEVRNKKNEILTYKTVFFQRSNPVKQSLASEDYALIDITNTFVAAYTNTDTLKDYIACLWAISTSIENTIEENQIARADVKSMQQFIYYFWSKRDATNPEQKWIDYKAEVEKVNAKYSMYNRKGYDSDRGRVYLKYGSPNSIDIEAMSATTLPYEIWHYYKLGKESNRKFVFYTRDRSSNNYVLLHSDAIGEPFNADWLSRIKGGSGSNMDEDVFNQKSARPGTGFGPKPNDDFNHPK